MVSPVATHSSPYVQRANSNPSLAVPAPAKTVPGGVTDSKQASVQVSVTRVEIRGQSISHGCARPEGVDAYKAVGDSREPANPFASTILKFIDAQLQRDLANGASAEELAGRLQAGLKGFEEGYSQAYEQLAASGFLNDGVKAEIEQTRNQVLAGIQKLADELGVEVKLSETALQQAAVPSSHRQQEGSSEPVMHPGKSLLSAVLRDVQIIEQYQKMSRAEATYTNPAKPRTGAPSAAVSYGLRESRDFSLKLRTADGDAVTIRLGNQKSGASAVNTDSQGRANIALRGSQNSSFHISVEGELDEGELRALTDLLGQVGEISEQFFAGDLEAAFQLASDLAVDQSEITSFDIRWSMSRTEVAESSMPKSDGGHSTASFVSPADKFVTSVMRAADFAERLGQPRSLVGDLLDWIAQNNSHQDARNALLAPAARAFL